ncbi:MAG: FkbM family methyltransferase [Bacteroidetes bacterium]|nr:MAG: FkbM family methyltransferase [Bacteroidota bacterium]
MIYKIKLILQLLIHQSKYLHFFSLISLFFRSRYQQTSISLFGKKFQIADAWSFVIMFDEIFNKKIYQFPSAHPKPFIIDCGVNVGASLLFFKRLFPKSQIIGFEPDPKIYQIATKNISSFDLKNITLVQKALWNTETTLHFASTGADGGRLGDKNLGQNIEVQTVSLRNYLTQKVDFLKIDIEGAEDTVLKDCADLLPNVERMFVEYHSFANQKQSLNQILDILGQAGFRYYIERNGVRSPQPYLNIDTLIGMDLQLNIFAYR